MSTAFLKVEAVDIRNYETTEHRGVQLQNNLLTVQTVLVGNIAEVSSKSRRQKVTLIWFFISMFGDFIAPG